MTRKDPVTNSPTRDNYKLSTLNSFIMRKSIFGPIGLICVMFVWAFGWNCASAQQKLVAERPIEHIVNLEIQGSGGLLKPGATILIGEFHGTWETPILIASIVRQAATLNVETILCIECCASEQASIDCFLNSEGHNMSIDNLLGSPHWSNQDGRASVGIFGMLELLRRLRHDGKMIQVVAMDSNWESPSVDPATLTREELRRLEELTAGRDLAMSKSVIQTRKQSPNAIVIAFAGDVHTRMIKGTSWDAEYIPMGWYVSQEVKDVVSLITETAGGKAWIQTDRGIGPTTIGGKNRGETPFVELFDAPQLGYHGFFYVGKITVAKPAKDGG